MKTKKLVWILLGAFLIFFSIGILSLRYNDGFRLVNFIRHNPIKIESDDSQVNIGDGKIDVRDKGNHVVIGWDGIKVKTPKENVEIGWDGIKIDDGKSKFRISDIFGIRRWGNFSYDLEDMTVDEKQTSSLDGIKNVDISSSFVDIIIRPEERDNLLVHYHGNMKSNTLPILSIEKRGHKLEIKLESSDRKNSYSVANSNVVLEISVPKDYFGDYNLSTASGDLYLNDLQGSIFNLSSSSGNILFKNIRGERLNFSSSSGDISVEDSQGDLDISTSSGEIYISNKNSNDNILVSTSSGDVSIDLAKEANYTITGSSFSGSFTSSLAMEVEENQGGIFKANIGQGEKKIDISTSSGSVKFRER